MKSSPASVVMPAWNAEPFIEAAVRSALDQTVPPAVIVVVDDGSTDGTAATAGSLDGRVQVLRREHAGPGPARTAGVAATDSELVAFLDADDLWLPQKLERQIDIMTDPSVDAVFCLADEFHDPDHPPPVGVRAPKRGVAAALSSAALVRRELLDRLGPFRSTPVGEWAGWWARARAEGAREEYVPEVLFRRRIHDDNNSFRRDDGGRTFLEIAREHSRAMRATRERG